jgi:CRP-like cAMP-binding protein
MIFSLKPTHVEEGDLVLAVGQKADAIIFVERGVIEVVTHFEGEEFIIDLLKSGSSINSHSYISEETMVVNYRAARDCHILKLHREDMD